MQINAMKAQHNNSHRYTNPMIMISDLSQSSPLEDNDDVSLSDESTKGTSFQASCNTSTFNHCMPTKQEVSDYHSIQPPSLHKHMVIRSDVGRQIFQIES